MKIVIPAYEIKQGGGPAGYINYINTALKGFSCRDIEIVTAISDGSLNVVFEKKNASIKNLLIKIIGKKIYDYINAKIRFPYIIKTKLIPKIGAIKSSKKIIHAHDPIIFKCLFKYAKKNNMRIIYTQHSPLPVCIERGKFSYGVDGKIKISKIDKRMEKLERFAFENADAIFAPTEYSHDSYRDFLPWFNGVRNEKKFIYCPTGIQSVMHRVVDTADNKYKLDERKMQVGFIGRYQHDKGYDIYCDCAKILSDKGFVFCSAGDGPLKNNSEYVMDFGWISDVQELIKACDIFVIANRFTYFDLLPLEVIAQGKSVILSNVGGNKYFINKSPGILVVENNAESIADALVSLSELEADQKQSNNDRNKNLYFTEHTGQKFLKQYMKSIKKFADEKIN